MPWSSKEVLDDGPITDKADIFSYGLLIWEMLALDVPHVNLIRGKQLETTVDSNCSILGIEDNCNHHIGKVEKGLIIGLS